MKNLENVQGDERDHMIISTTFGPDPNGKFRRNFGPVGRAGGGRRLNVLVTRAREAIHLVTSIPRNEYAVLPPIEPGHIPSGRWLLYSYLLYAKALGDFFEKERGRLGKSEAAAEPALKVNESRTPSKLAACLARRLAAEHAMSSDVHWGNDGFCVDIAVQHPRKPEDVTIGVLCDMTRFSNAAVEWELFRTAVLEHQGWKFHRVWSPRLFSDPERHEREIAEASQRFIAETAALTDGAAAAVH